MATKTDDDKTVYVKVVHSGREPRTMEIALSGGYRMNEASVRLVSAPDLNIRNTIDHPDRVKESDGAATIEDSVAKVVLPPYSVAVVTIQRMPCDRGWAAAWPV